MRMKPLATILISFGLPFSAECEAATCQEITAAAHQLSLAQATELMSSGHTGRTYKSLFDECDKSNTYDGKPTRGRCRGKKPDSGDQNKVTDVWKYPNGVVVFGAKAGVDADGSPFSKKANWPDQSETSLKWTTPKESLNAEDVSFIVLPQFDGKSSMAADAGLKKGDLAVVLYGNLCSVALVGDYGPYFRLGEVSLKTQADLGNPQCTHEGEHPCTSLIGGGQGVSVPSGVTYIVFPKSGLSPRTPQTFAAARDATLERAKNFLTAYK